MCQSVGQGEHRIVMFFRVNGGGSVKMVQGYLLHDGFRTGLENMKTADASQLEFVASRRRSVGKGRLARAAFGNRCEEFQSDRKMRRRRLKRG